MLNFFYNLITFATLGLAVVTLIGFIVYMLWITFSIATDDGKNLKGLLYFPKFILFSLPVIILLSGIGKLVSYLFTTKL